MANVNLNFTQYPTPYRIPLIAWNRLEGRPRHEEFNESLAMSIHDPLWMMTRQWQFGEYKAENRGSSILAKIAMESKRLTHHTSIEDEDFDAYPTTPNDIPLEVLLERLEPRLTLFQKAEIGKILIKKLRRMHMANGGSSQAAADAIQNLLEAFPFEVPAEPDAINWNQKINDISLLSNKKSRQYIASIAGRLPDGWSIYKSLKTSPGSIGSVLPTYQGDGTELEETFVAWVEKTYAIPNTDLWHKDSLEYKMKIGYQSDSGSQGTYDTLKAEYDNGKVDWYSFDRDLDAVELTNGDGQDVPESVIDVVSVIPSSAKFQGMPNKRLWKLEDAKIDLAHLDIDRSEIVKQVLAEFALVYSNDWATMPYSFPMNSMNRVKGIVITDVFGENTLLNSSTMNSPLTSDIDGSSWTKWSLYSNDKNFSSDAVLNNSIQNSVQNESLFIAPTIISSLHGETIEEVYFMRDEIDNRVYAIESKVFHQALGMREGELMSNELKNYLKDILVDTEDSEFYAQLVYKLGDEIPDNWIPFVPVRKENSTRSIVLQRAALPRFSNTGQAHIRPRTELLRFGLNEDDSQSSPYFINEEEIPRTGIKISDQYQRTRWHGGKTYLWLARQKKIEKLPVSSGLSFDNIIIKQPNEVSEYNAPDPI